MVLINSTIEPMDRRDYRVGTDSWRSSSRTTALTSRPSSLKALYTDFNRRMPMPPHKPMTFRWTSQWEPVHTHRYASNARRRRVADTLPPTIHCGHCKTLNPRTPTGDENLNNSNKNKDHLRLGNLRSSSWRVEMVPSPSSASATDVRLHNFLREPSFVATVFDQLHPVKPSGTRPPARESPPSPGTP